MKQHGQGKACGVTRSRVELEALVRQRPTHPYRLELTSPFGHGIPLGLHAHRRIARFVQKTQGLPQRSVDAGIFVLQRPQRMCGFLDPRPGADRCCHRLPPRPSHLNLTAQASPGPPSSPSLPDDSVHDATRSTTIPTRVSEITSLMSRGPPLFPGESSTRSSTDNPHGRG
jgi:hypothetical protein